MVTLKTCKNKVAVEEEVAQFDDILKLVVAAHGQYKQYMEGSKSKSTIVMKSSVK